MAELHTVSISGGALRRGFWLYVWDIRLQDDRQLLYVGRTGDSSSLHAQSPLNRLSQHLGRNEHSNALLRYFRLKGIDLDDCRMLEMIAFGPIFDEQPHDKIAHQKARDRVAALEKKLADALSESGYSVLNDVKCRTALDPAAWKRVRAAFTQRFDLLQRKS